MLAQVLGYRCNPLFVGLAGQCLCGPCRFERVASLLESVRRRQLALACVIHFLRENADIDRGAQSIAESPLHLDAHPQAAWLDDAAQAALDGGAVIGRNEGFVVVGDVLVAAVEQVQHFGINVKPADLA